MMKVTVQDLVEKLSTQQVKLIAGETGIRRRVSMVHIVENTEIAKFLLGGEIVLINGIALNSDLTLVDLVKFIHTKQVGAVVICTGPYITAVDAATIALAHTNHIPLFSAPWEVYCANLIKDISRELLEAESKNTKIEVALKAALQGDSSREFYEEQLLEKGWNMQGNYCVTLIQGQEASSPALNMLQENIKYLLDARPQHMESRATVLKIKGCLAVVFCDMPEKAIYEITCSIQSNLSSDALMHMVIGQRIIGAHLLHQSYKIALKMLPLFHAIQEHENPFGHNFVDYERLNLYKILLAIDDMSILKSYYDQTIAPLVQYDAFRGSELCHTLKTYMKYNGSVIRVADELFAHRNTIGKQINKIESILDEDLSDWQVRNKIMLGFFVQDLIT